MSENESFNSVVISCHETTVPGGLSIERQLELARNMARDIVSINRAGDKFSPCDKSKLMLANKMPISRQNLASRRRIYGPNADPVFARLTSWR
jgi:hypothetical protein